MITYILSRLWRGHEVMQEYISSEREQIYLNKWKSQVTSELQRRISPIFGEMWRHRNNNESQGSGSSHITTAPVCRRHFDSLLADNRNPTSTWKFSVSINRATLFCSRLMLSSNKTATPL